MTAWTPNLNTKHNKPTGFQRLERTKQDQPADGGRCAGMTLESPDGAAVRLHQSRGSSYLWGLRPVLVFRWVWRVLIRCRFCHWNPCCSCQHQNIHKLRHNGHNAAPMLKCACVCVCAWAPGVGLVVVVGGCTSVSIQTHLWHIPWPWSLCRAWLCSLGFVYGSRLVYYEARHQPWRDVGPRCFISCQGLASIKLMESIQLFPFQAQTTEENTLKRS